MRSLEFVCMCCALYLVAGSGEGDTTCDTTALLQVAADPPSLLNNFAGLICKGSAGPWGTTDKAECTKQKNAMDTALSKISKMDKRGIKNVLYAGELARFKNDMYKREAHEELQANTLMSRENDPWMDDVVATGAFTRPRGGKGYGYNPFLWAGINAMGDDFKNLLIAQQGYTLDDTPFGQIIHVEGDFLSQCDWMQGSMAVWSVGSHLFVNSFPKSKLKFIGIAVSKTHTGDKADLWGSILWMVELQTLGREMKNNGWYPEVRVYVQQSFRYKVGCRGLAMKIRKRITAAAGHEIPMQYACCGCSLEGCEKNLRSNWRLW